MFRELLAVLDILQVAPLRKQGIKDCTTLVRLVHQRGKESEMEWNEERRERQKSKQSRTRR